MSITALGSSFGYVPPTTRQTAPSAPPPQLPQGPSPAERLGATASGIATGPEIANLTPFERLIDRLGETGVALQEASPPGSGTSPREAARAYGAGSA